MEHKENEIKVLRSRQEKSMAEFEMCFLSMKSAKEKLAIWDQKISELMNENQKLKTRAAVSFDELTPRPSFQNFNLLCYLFFYFLLV